MIRSDIKAITAYHVPDDAGMIKLDAMENPYPLPDALRDEWSSRISGLNINRYPDADMHELHHTIAELDGLSGDQVLLGNGSDEIIQMLLIGASKGTCVTPRPTFVMYEIIARWLRRPVAIVPLTRDFGLNAEGFLRASSLEKAAITFLACPNNPTGNMWPRSVIRQILDKFQGLLIIDEAYRPFADDTHVDMIKPNVVVLRTFSKLGLAGLRLGYALGHSDTIAHLNKVRLPYNISSLTHASARFFLEHLDIFDKQAGKIRDERSRVAQALAAMEQVHVYPSQANFLLLRVPDANAAFAGLRQRGILIKNLHDAGGLLENCLRVTIGTPEENDQFLSALKETICETDN